MANTDSFIDEVNEQVRKDRFYYLLKRWGWVPAILVIVLVGGTAWNQWREAQQAASAQAFGDAVLSALSEEEAEDRRSALAAIETEGVGQTAILGLLQAGAAAAPDGPDAAPTPEAAREGLQALANLPELPAKYRHPALMKLILVGGTGTPAEDGLILEELAAPGAPFRPLAVEQQAYRALEAGDEGTAVTLLRTLLEDAESSEVLRRRAQQMMLVLGADLEPA